MIVLKGQAVPGIPHARESRLVPGRFQVVPRLVPRLVPGGSGRGVGVTDMNRLFSFHMLETIWCLFLLFSEVQGLCVFDFATATALAHNIYYYYTNRPTK